MNEKAFKITKLVEGIVVLAVSVALLAFMIATIRYSLTGKNPAGIIYFFIGIMGTAVVIPGFILGILSTVKIASLKPPVWSKAPFVLSMISKIIWAYSLLVFVTSSIESGLVLNACIYGIVLLLFTCSAITDVAISTKIISRQKNELTVRSNQE